jgi:hypothetical protein
MLHEMDYHKDNVFLTLTYDNKDLPLNKTVEQAELQKFFKRLRKRTDRRGKKIKHFSCGEYGDPASLVRKGPYWYMTEGDRPHYHCIIFGLGPNNEDKKDIMHSWEKCDWNVAEIREDAFGTVERKSIQYVASYINEKFDGDLAIEEYTNKNREPVFRMFSRGLGKDHVLDNYEMYLENQHTKLNGTKIALPRYYINKLREKFAIENYGEYFEFEKAKEHIQEEEEKYIERITGLRMSIAEALTRIETSEQTDKQITMDNHQRELNAIAKKDLKGQRQKM